LVWVWLNSGNRKGRRWYRSPDLAEGRRAGFSLRLLAIPPLIPTITDAARKKRFEGPCSKEMEHEVNLGGGGGAKLDHQSRRAC